MKVGEIVGVEGMGDELGFDDVGWGLSVVVVGCCDLCVRGFGFVL